MKLTLLPERFAVVKLGESISSPPGIEISDRNLLAYIYAQGEKTLVCREQDILEGSTAETGWRALVVEGPLGFELTGILAALAQTLANAEISIFALSTYSTDIILIKETMLTKASEALEAAGHLLL